MPPSGGQPDATPTAARIGSTSSSGTASFGLGFALVGTLPTDVSSTLLVYIARGNVGLATVLNAIDTALAPVLVPALFLLYTGVELDVPVAALGERATWSAGSNGERPGKSERPGRVRTAVLWPP